MLLTNILPLSYIINHDISRSYFSDGAKENYCPVSVLNGFSKVYERFINDSMLSIIQTFLSNIVSACRKHYNANHVLIENWKKNIYNNEIVCAIFTDSSKVLIAYIIFTYSHNGKLWFEWERSYFSIFMPRALKTIC